MKISTEELQQAYRKMSDGELVELDRDELTEVARQCHAAEMARRGLVIGPDGAPVAADDEEEPAACAGVFRTAEEAEAVRGMLESSGIPARVEQDLGDLLWMGSTPVRTIRVLVPESLAEEAHGLIESHATGQEIAARAEADPLPEVVLARYEGGVFKPLEEVELPEGTEVEVHLPAR